MDLGLAKVAPVEPSAKRQAVGSGSSELNRIIALLCKISLSNAQYTRILRSVMLDVWQIPADHPLVEAVRASNVQFDKSAKELGSPEARRKTLGERHVHAWNAVLGWLVGVLTKGGEATAASLATVNEYIGKYQGLGVHQLAMEVKFLRIKKVYSQEFKNLELNTSPDSPSATVQEILAAELAKGHRVQRLPGVPPPGDLERRVQQWLVDNGFSTAATEQ